MSIMNDNIEQKCYLQYLLSKYISRPCSESLAQEFETRYNATNWYIGHPHIIMPTTEQH